MRFFLRLLLLVIIANGSGCVFSQTERDTIRNDQNYYRQTATFPTSEKVVGKYHYVGFQANQLLRQLLGSAGSADNPYLFAYSFNSVDRGSGMNFGLGFNFQTIDDSDPGINLKRSTKSNTSAIRIGYDRKKPLGKRWIVGYGFDLFRSGGKSETETTVSSGGGNFVNTVSTKTNGIGLGPRLSLLFNVSEKIYLGTEATSYFLFEKTTSKGDPNFPTAVETALKEKSFKLGVPTALFIMIRF